MGGEGRGDAHHRQQYVVVGIAVAGAGQRDQRPAGHLFIDRGAAEIQGVGAVARRVAGQARGHPHQLVEGDVPARIAVDLPVGDGGGGVDIDLAALHRRPDQGPGQTLGHRPGALGHVGAEARGIGFADQMAVLQDNDPGGVGTGTIAVAHPPDDGGGEGLNRAARRPTGRIEQPAPGR